MYIIYVKRFMMKSLHPFNEAINSVLKLYSSYDIIHVIKTMISTLC